MAKKGSAGRKTKTGYGEDLEPIETALTKRAGRPSSLLDTRVIYCGDNLEQLAKPALSLSNGLRDRCVDLTAHDATVADEV